jgi:hypothetical protein
MLIDAGKKPTLICWRFFFPVCLGYSRRQLLNVALSVLERMLWVTTSIGSMPIWIDENQSSGGWLLRKLSLMCTIRKANYSRLAVNAPDDEQATLVGALRDTVRPQYPYD